MAWCLGVVDVEQCRFYRTTAAELDDRRLQADLEASTGTRGDARPLTFAWLERSRCWSRRGVGDAVEPRIGQAAWWARRRADYNAIVEALAPISAVDRPHAPTDAR